ncbi:MAG TPA: universal stress protein [Nitrosopumilaceae archaeon]|nr:universal stress protein [Nitrosopumilaceae archaeon]
MYKTILVPHAGTPAGDDALKHAIFIAKASSAKIILLHIVEQLQYPPTFALASSERESLLASIKSANNSIKKEMKVEMEKKKGICKKNNVEAETEVEIGSAAEVIIKTIKEQNVDMIVMAKRRKLKGVKKLLSLGSVSRKIVENVKCPVLLIDIET